MEKRAQNYIAVRVDSDEREDLVRAWSVSDLPTVIFLGPQGGVLARNDKGAIRTGEDLLALMDVADAALWRLRSVEQGVAQAPDDLTRRQALGKHLMALALWDRAVATFEHILEHAPEKAAGTRAQAEEYLVYLELRRGKYEAGVTRADGYATRYPKNRDLPKILFWRASCLRGLGRTPEAIAALEEVIKRFPEDPTAQQAREAVARWR